MSIFDKFSTFLRPEEDYEGDDYYLDDDYVDDDSMEDYEEEAPRLGFFNRSRSSDTSSTRAGGLFSRRSDVLSVAPPAMQVTMKRPRAVNDFQDICDDLLDGKAVVINLEGVGSDVAQRVIDFTFGAIYSIRGDLREISRYIFIASPQTIELSGEFGSGMDLDTSSVRSSLSDRSGLKASGGFGFN